MIQTDKSATLKPDNSQTLFQPKKPIYCIDRASFNQGKNAQFSFQYNSDEIAYTKVAKGPGAVVYEKPLGLAMQSSAGCGAVLEDVIPTIIIGDNPGWQNGVCQKCKTKYIVRRLTPIECERLQGFPDNWTDVGDYTSTNGRKSKTVDTARYKALGNSIAIPPWKWVIKRLCSCYERDATMASLFDGIGGFPYIWEQFNGKGSCVWSSEIEYFPIAVAERRINEK